MTQDLCRAEFEKWYGSKPEFGNYCYVNQIVQARWEAWRGAWYTKPTTEHNDEFDYSRVKEWALSKPRKSANTSFTASTNRNVAYLIEDLELPHNGATEHNPADTSQNVEYE